MRPAELLVLLDTDPAAGLRDTAALMRERAEAATPGPWDMDLLRFGCWQITAPASDGDPGFTRSVADRLQEHDAEHITSWPPAVALAVADWLERDAEGWERLQEIGIPDIEDSFATALAVARAYLGGAS